MPKSPDIVPEGSNYTWMLGGEVSNEMQVEVWSITIQGDDFRGVGQVFDATGNSFKINYEGESTTISYSRDNVNQTIKVKEV